MKTLRLVTLLITSLLLSPFKATAHPPNEPHSSEAPSATTLAISPVMDSTIRMALEDECTENPEFIPVKHCFLNNHYHPGDESPRVMALCEIGKHNRTVALSEAITTLQTRQHKNQQYYVLLMTTGFASIRILTGHTNAPSLINSMITAPVASLTYLENINNNRSMSDMAAEPPSYENTLENLSPLVLYSYAIYEFSEALYSGKTEYIAHGFAMISGCAATHHEGKIRLAIYGMVTETSQVFFNAGYLHKTFFMRKRPSRIFFAPFAFFFFASRWIIFPWEHYKFIRNTYLVEEEYRKAPLMNTIITVTGFAGDLLNLYWGILIIRNVKRYL
ncbi:MAG: TLC domain-containing protein [Endozoicomonas sp.]|uniref:TLC domain-containing protein n=1 Tax=Endozoicomonas sp. TaxID=1892382 RepID=UPI003D9B265E